MQKKSRYVTYATAAASVFLVALVVSIGLRGGSQVAVSPSPTSSPEATSQATPQSTVATASPSGGAASTRYASAGLGYSIEMPSPWHRSTCSPAIVSQEGVDPALETFVPVSAHDETGTDVGVAYPTLRVFVEANPQSLSPRQWAEQARTVGGMAGEHIEDVVYAGRSAARKTVALSGTPLGTYFVADGGRMYVVNPAARVPPDGATQQTMIRMIESFGFLTDAEVAAARAAIPTPLPPRAPEQVADGVAAAMTAKWADALSAFLATCVTTAGEQAGASFVSREKYVDDLRVAFAAGLVVTVQPRPLEGDLASGNLTVASTWRDSNLARQRKLMLRRGENDRWEWHGTLERF